MRVFLDTNVLVAAFATRGLCSDVLRTILAEHQMVVSDTILEELSRALAGKLRLPPAVARDIVRFVRQHADLAAEGKALPGVDVRDAADAVVLAAALASGADVLITGDRDLLVLEADPGIPIVTPRGFWEMIRTVGSGL